MNFNSVSVFSLFLPARDQSSRMFQLCAASMQFRTSPDEKLLMINHNTACQVNSFLTINCDCAQGISDSTEVMNPLAFVLLLPLFLLTPTRV